MYGKYLVIELIHCNFFRVRKEIWKNYWIREETQSKPGFKTLLDLSVEKVFSSGINFFNEEIPESLKHYMSLTYLNYNICYFCNIATDCSKPGYFYSSFIHYCVCTVNSLYIGVTGFTTVTFQTPYLGNTCVPFQHWACSKKCVVAIEVPAKKLQLEGAKRLDYEYSHYIAKSKKDDKIRNSKKSRSLCRIC